MSFDGAAGTDQPALALMTRSRDRRSCLQQVIGADWETWTWGLGIGLASVPVFSPGEADLVPPSPEVSAAPPEQRRLPDLLMP